MSFHIATGACLRRPPGGHEVPLRAEGKSCGLSHPTGPKFLSLAEVIVGGKAKYDVLHAAVSGEGRGGRRALGLGKEES